MPQSIRPRDLAQDAKRLSRRRVIAGLDQKDAAELARISRSHLCRLEKGEKGASPATLHRLAEIYRCNVEDLMPAETPAAVSAVSGE